MKEKKQQLIKIAQDIVRLEKEYKEGKKAEIIEKQIIDKITTLSFSDMLFIDDYIMKNNLLTK